MEAAWQASKKVKVKLYEMRPHTMTPAHKTGSLAELVCSNSLRADALSTAPGLLKKELSLLDSIILSCALEARVEAGGALAVDREDFSRRVEEAVFSNPNIEVHREEIKEIPEGNVIIATGPLTSPVMADEIKKICGEDHFYFYDAVAPIISKESIDFTKVFRASRYDKGQGYYLNCPMTEEEYNIFYDALIGAEKVIPHSFEEEKFFEGCLPVEEIARRGIKSLRFGPLKPVGIANPEEPEKKYYAVVQLRQENLEDTMYNIVGFQTRLKWGEQKRVFRLIPGLEKAVFYRLGMMHRNNFINSPKHLNGSYVFKERKNLLFAGQITGVEGYLESTSSGLVAGINGALIAEGKEPLVFPRDTATGALCHHISSAPVKKFEPMKINFGLFTPLEGRIKKKERREIMANRALKELRKFKEENLL